MASLFESQACLIFNSGYQANVGIISALLGKEDIVFADKFVHASQLDGVRLSGAFLCRYRHLDLIHLALLLKKYRYKYRRALVLTEGLFSMDGDQSNLAGLVDLKKKYDCSLMVDDAHSFGVLGQRGLGLAYAYRKDIDFLLTVNIYP